MLSNYSGHLEIKNQYIQTIVGQTDSSQFFMNYPNKIVSINYNYYEPSLLPINVIMPIYINKPFGFYSRTSTDFTSCTNLFSSHSIISSNYGCIIYYSLFVLFILFVI